MGVEGGKSCQTWSGEEDKQTASLPHKASKEIQNTPGDKENQAEFPKELISGSADPKAVRPGR